MAIHPSPEASSHQPVPADHEMELTQQLLSMTIAAHNQSTANNPNAVRGTSVTLAIDLDEHGVPKHDRDDAQRPRREPMRRDSLKRREALLKGKEGTRRRRQWENDRLMNNPWAQPPLPSDWEVRPYPKRVVPYYLAPLWDQDAAARKEAREKARLAAQKKAIVNDEGQGSVPREIREKLKKAKAAKGLLRDLEEQVRLFVKGLDHNDKGDKKADMDSEDEEIVFVGRNGHMHDVPPSPKFRDSLDSDEEERQQLVFDSDATDQGASFGRWLVHSIATYYGLRSWSVTVGDPARREAYVGIPVDECRPENVSSALPRPLWGLV